MSLSKQALEDDAAALARSFIAAAAAHQPAYSPYAIVLAAIKLAATTTAALKVPLEVVNVMYLEQRNRADEVILNRRPK